MKPSDFHKYSPIGKLTSMACAFVSLLCCAESSGALISVTGIGNVFQADGVTSTITSVGESFGFSFKYDTNAAATYQVATEAQYSGAVRDFEFSLHNGPTVYLASGDNFRMNILNNANSTPLDAFQVNDTGPTNTNFPTVGGAPLQYWSLNISNLGGTPFNSTALPSSIDLNDFSNRRLQISFWNGVSFGGPGYLGGVVQGTVTSLNFATIPEPTTGLFVILGLFPLISRRRKA